MQLAQTRYTLRKSNLGDLDGVSALLRASYPSLMKTHYDAAELEPALKPMTRANPKLLASGSYYVAQAEDKTLVGCGGWSLERPGDHVLRDGIGHIRHFAVHPEWVRRGVGSAIYNRCAADARAAGVRKFECYASLNAEPFYAALGFQRIAIIEVRLVPNVSLAGCHMDCTL